MEVLIGAIGSLNQSIAQRLGVTRQHFPKLRANRRGFATSIKRSSVLDVDWPLDVRCAAIRALWRLRADPEPYSSLARASDHGVAA
jgi:hypothetical protein